jgi:hemoglobin
VQISVPTPGRSVFDLVGGRPFFDALVVRFYDGVATDPVLRPLYPEDLTSSIEHTAGFLAQFFGGGTVHYSDERGHPRLRMRHVHLAIGRSERDAWLAQMLRALHEAEGLDPAVEQQMVDYFEMASTHMINVDG